MAWLSITLETEGEQAEALSDALLEAGALAVELQEAAGAAPAQGEAPEAPRWPRVRLVALAGPQADPGALVAQAAASCGMAAPEFRASSLADEDWVRRSQAQFGPVRAGRRLWVVPSWCTPPDPGAVNVRLDPGLAFGTGGHPSTRLVLAWLEDTVRGGERLLDYGCGSGVLAIAGLLLGAREALAVDVDSRALDVARANAAANGVRLAVAAPEALDPTHAGYDVVVANILAATLVALEPEIATRAAPGARIALSGILDAQAADVIAAYATRFDLAVAAREDGWALVAGRRR
ncbi:MAG: 50S ribosomal protein L11 methyltransferase [Burkholderiales bacterium]|nr:50S ribosomal protein L11 methyltransferase [Burkholderiales bacterium]